MNDNINFQELWNNQTTTPQDTADFLNTLKSVRKAHLWRILWINTLFAATSVFIIYVWLSNKSEMITTDIGVIITIIVIGLFAIAQNQMRPVLKKIDSAVSNKDYLDNLLLLKAKQHTLQTTYMNLYFILLSLGIGLYLIEPCSKMPTQWAIFTYTLTLSWIAFNWFYIRPRTIKKQQEKLEEVIQKYEQVKGQLVELK